MSQTKQLGKTLMTVPEFSRFKDVSPTAVWKAIKEERIIVTEVGMKRHTFIDSKLYKAFQFADNKKNR